MRTFVAIDICEDTRRELVAVQQKFPRDQFHLKPVEEENLHITLKFLGEISEETVEEVVNAMEQSVAEESPFETEVGGLGVFPSLNYIRVIWAGVTTGGNSITRIERELEVKLAPLGFGREKNYIPHITLARVKTPKNKAELARIIRAHTETPFGKEKIEAITLKESRLTPEGPIYRDLHRVAFG